jgi:hypothetical protein
VIDLNQMVEHFINGATESYGDYFLKFDSPAINALMDRSQSAEDRQEHVRSFLRAYSVLQGLNKSEETAIVNEILEFADAHDLTRNPTSKEEILELFDDLHGRCQSKVHRNKDGNPRDLTSLTSKALWFCYPDAIPMFDSRAGQALCVISHLMGLNRPPLNSETRYKPFLSVWLDVYDRVKPTIDAIGENRLHGCTYKVRVLDMILWTIGGPDF